MEHLSQIGNSITCPVVMFVREGNLMMGLRHYKQENQETVSIWTIPGGRCEDNETIEQTLRREVAEEVGIKDFEIIGFIGVVPGAHQGDIVYIFAGTTDQEPQLMEPEKFSEWKWQSLDSMPENFINPAAFEITRNFYKNS